MTENERETLPDGTNVVRGGVATAEQLVDGCGEHEGWFGFSVQAHPGLTVDQLAEIGRFPHKKVSYTTIEKIRDLGYDAVPTGGAGRHATLVVPSDWSEQSAGLLSAKFEVKSNLYRRTSQ